MESILSQDSSWERITLPPSPKGVWEGEAEDKLISPRNLLETISEVKDKEGNEDEHDRMLHLSNGARIRMGRSCIKYL